MQTLLAVRMFGAALLICASITSRAQDEPVRMTLTNADATLLPADNPVRSDSVSTNSLIYRSWTGATPITGDPQRLQLGTALTFAGAGPQVRVNSLGLFVYSRAALVQQRVQLTLKFWEKYQVLAPDKAVFSRQPPMSQVTVDLIGPYNLEANKVYQISVTLPKPLLLNGYEQKGLAVQVLSTTGFGEPEPSADLLPAYDTGNAPQAGQTLASYASDGGMAYNFRGDENVVGQPLAIDIFGTAQKNVQCSTWTAGYRDQFIEEFDAGIDPLWQQTFGNGGLIDASAADGSLQLSAPNTGAFPYVRIPNPASPTLPIPSSGEFSVRWLERYDTTGPFGTGLAISQGLPAYATPDDLVPRAAWMWQDDNQGFHINVKTDFGTPNPTAAFQEISSSGSIHDIEYCWLNNAVELWVDGARVFNQTRNPNVPRPDSIWIGNHTNANGDWNNLTVFRVHVRKPIPADAIYFDGFE